MIVNGIGFRGVGSKGKSTRIWLSSTSIEIWASILRPWVLSIAIVVEKALHWEANRMEFDVSMIFMESLVAHTQKDQLFSNYMKVKVVSWWFEGIILRFPQTKSIFCYRTWSREWDHDEILWCSGEYSSTTERVGL